MKSASFALMAIIASLEVQACGVGSGDLEFNYDDLGDNWKVEGFHSPLCAAGTEQSPIDLVGGVFNDNLALFIDGHANYEEEDTKFFELKTHTLELALDVGTLEITHPDGETDVFDAVQFHAHSPSEHSINGHLKDLEIHFVHVHPDGDKFAVIGVFFQSGDYDENEFIKQLLIDEVKEDGADLLAVDVEDFLDELHTDSFWHYDGSFTTPPCTEGVEWFVMKEIQEITVDQLEAFQAFGWGNGNFVNGEGNNRRTQPILERTLYSIGEVTFAGGPDETEGEGDADAGEDATDAGEDAAEAGEDATDAGEDATDAGATVAVETEDDSHDDGCGCNGCGGNDVKIEINFNVDTK